MWLQAAGYRTMHVGRYLNGYDFRDGIPAGYTDWYGSPHANAFNYANWKVNENGVLRSYPQPERPDDYQTDQSTRRAVGLIEDAAPSAQPFYMSLWYVAPHRGGPRDLDDPPSPGTPSPAPRHRDAFAGLLDAATPELQREVDVRQASGGGRPATLHAREGRRHRGELAPGARELARRRRGRRPDHGCAAPQRRAREHADRLHVRQRLHARGAPGAGREGAALRAVDPDPAPDARPRHPARPRRRAARREPRRAGDDPGRRAASPRGASSMGARCSTCPPTPARSGAAAS